MKHGTVVVKDAEQSYRWTFWRDTYGWILRDHTGYLRTLETTWAESVHRIRAIAENHGFSVNVS